MYRIMFICSGNICRSPLAHAVFQSMVEQNNLEDVIHVESSGTGAWHVGEQTDYRMRQTASRHGLSVKHRARQLFASDLADYDLLLVMDEHNYRDTLALAVNESEKEKVQMFRDFDASGSGSVPDPWYGTMKDFENVWGIVSRTCTSLMEEIRHRIKLK